MNGSMKRVTVLVALAMSMLALLAVVSGGAAAAPCDTTLSAVDNIQAAIDAATPGDVICLAAGTYSPPAKIKINKSITLQGPQAGVDPRPSAGSSRVAGDTGSEAVIDGSASGLSGIIVITADNVTLEGLDVKSGSGDLIDSESSLPTSGTMIRYNIVHNATGDEGMQIRNCADCTIEYNYLTDIAQDGINMCCGSTGGIVQFNEVTDNSSENGAIYVYDAEYTTIKCNLVSNVLGNDGIKLGAKGGGDAALSGGSILYNTIHDTVQDGITVYTSDATVEGNEVYNSLSENGAIYVAQAVSNITITGNNIHDNTLNAAKWGDPGAVMIGTDVDATTVTVNNNNLTDNTVNGLTNKAAAPLDGEDNWWGAADGPSGAGSGSGDAVSANVDFDPWLAAPAEIADMCNPDDEGPPTTNVVADPNPAPVDSSVAVTALVDDTNTGGSDIASAEFTVYEYSYDTGQGTEVASGPMSAVDGAFDSPTEEVEADFTAAFEPEVYQLCVSGSDSAGNDGPESCILFVVYDPSAGFVTGGGWIDSLSGAYKLSDMNITKLVWDQGFEVDSAGWFDINSGWYGEITRVPSGENGIPSADGAYHAIFEGDADSAPFSRFDQYRDTWAGTWTAEVDVYLDPSWLAGTGFDYSVAANGSDGNHQRDYIFHVTKDTSTGNLLVAGSNNTNFAPREDLDTINHFVVTSAGWYTLQHVFYENAGALAVDLNLLDSARTVLFTETRYNAGDVIPDEVGGNRYAWFTFINVPGGIAIDNHQLFFLTGPEGKANFGFVSKYNRGKSIPSGNTTFVFQNAGLNFKSDSYDWLVVTGSNYAKFKGEGTINNQLAPNGEPYKFMLWAGDGTGSGGEDTFRIKIWYEDGGDVIVYDNGMDQAIGSGNIVVHKGKK